MARGEASEDVFGLSVLKALIIASQLREVLARGHYGIAVSLARDYLVWRFIFEKKLQLLGGEWNGDPGWAMAGPRHK